MNSNFAIDIRRIINESGIYAYTASCHCGWWISARTRKSAAQQSEQHLAQSSCDGLLIPPKELIA